MGEGERGVGGKLRSSADACIAPRPVASRKLKLEEPAPVPIGAGGDRLLAATKLAEPAPPPLPPPVGASIGAGGERRTKLKGTEGFVSGGGGEGRNGEGGSAKRMGSGCSETIGMTSDALAPALGDISMLCESEDMLMRRRRHTLRSLVRRDRPPRCKYREDQEMPSTRSATTTIIYPTRDSLGYRIWIGLHKHPEPNGECHQL